MKLIFFIFLFASFAVASAQTTTQEVATAAQATSTASSSISVPSNSKAILLARVQIAGTSLTTLADKTYQGSFTVLNNGEVLEGASYRIVLVNAEGSVVSTQTFERTVSLSKNIPVSVSEKVLVPKGLDGMYSVQAQVLTSTGVPLASAILNTLTLHEKAAASLSSCAVAKALFRKNEQPVVTCTVIGTPSSESAIGVRLFYGNEPKILQSTSTRAVKGKNTLTLSPLLTPGNYIVRVSLYENGIPSGEEKSVLFTLEGAQASLTTISIDKNFYKMDDVAQITFSFNSFTGGTSTSLFATADIVGKNGPCIGGTKDALPATSAMSISVPVIKECIDPTLTVQIVDEAGTTYDKKTMTLVSPAITKTMPIEKSSPTPLMYGLGGAALLLALGGAGYFAFARMKKPAVAPVSTIATPTPEIASEPNPAVAKPNPAPISPEIPAASNEIVSSSEPAASQGTEAQEKQV